MRARVYARCARVRLYKSRRDNAVVGGPVIKRIQRLLSTVVLVGILPITNLAAKDDLVKAAVMKQLRSAGVVQYSHKPSYGGGIDDVYLGYGGAGKPIVGIATRGTKTYKKVTTVLVITVSDGKYRIKAAEIPDMSKLPGQSYDLAEQALSDLTGKVLADGKAARGLVDAVSGATKYYKAIYVSYGLMATKVIQELQANPTWKRLDFK